MVKLSILERREYSGLSRWVQWNHESPCKREARKSKLYKGRVRMEPEDRVVQSPDKACRWLLGARKGKAHVLL